MGLFTVGIAKGGAVQGHNPAFSGSYACSRRKFYQKISHLGAVGTGNDIIGRIIVGQIIFTKIDALIRRIINLHKGILLLCRGRNVNFRNEQMALRP